MEQASYKVSDLQDDAREARRIERLLREHRPDLMRDPELQTMIEGYQRRAQMAREIQSIAPGRKIELVNVGQTPVLAWVFKKGDSPIHVNFNLLEGDALTAKRSTYHELTHLLTPRSLEMEEAWRDPLTPLFKLLGLPEEAWQKGLDTPFVEGYVEGKTIDRYGRDPNVLYTNREVPFVQALERMGQDWLGISFRSLFFKHQIDDFKKQLWLLCQMLQGVGDA